MSARERDYLSDSVAALDLGLAIIGRDHRIIVWNPWLSAATGIAAEQAVGTTLKWLFPGSNLRQLDAAVTQAFESGTSRVLTHALHRALLPLKTRSGQDLYHNISIRPLGSEPFEACMVQFTDVTAAANRERALRARQDARYDAVVNSATDAIITLDAGGLIQLVNPAAAQKFRYSARDLFGRHVSLLVGDHPAWKEAWEAALAGKPLAQSVEIVARRNDGTPSYMDVSASRWSSDDRIFVTAILRDANERHAAEEELKRLNQTLERRVEDRTAERDRMWRLSTDVMMVMQSDGTINAVNPAWHALLGWNESELVGTNVLNFIPLGDRAAFKESLNALARGTERRLFEVHVRGNDRDQRLIEWSAVRADGLLHAVGRDVTGQREAEAALAKAEAALRQSQKMEAIGNLTGGVAHDFNNLLQVIIGNLQLLAKDLGSNFNAQRRVQNALAGVSRGAKLASQLLAIGRRQPLTPRVVSVAGFIRDIDEILRRSLGAGIDVRVEIEDKLWNTLIDPSNLENALLNLAINARDAMDGEGKLVIAAKNAVLDLDFLEANPDVAPGEYVLLQVGDTGTGMPSEIMSKVFDPFFTTKPVGKGTGLGLAMVYGFVKQSGGHIQIASELGKGTTISLYFPRSMAAADATPEAVPENVVGGTETLMVVEDDEPVREAVVAILRDIGYRVLVAKDAQHALSVLQGGARVDLMFTDVIMPGPLKSTELARMARELLPNIAVLYTSGYAEDAIAHAGRIDDGVDILIKPYTREALARKIRLCLETEQISA